MGSEAHEAHSISRDLVELYRLARLTAARARAGAGGDEAALAEAVGARIENSRQELMMFGTINTRQLDELSGEHERFKRLRGLVRLLARAPTPEDRAKSADLLAEWLVEQLPRRVTDPSLRPVPDLGRPVAPAAGRDALDKAAAAETLRGLMDKRIEHNGPVRSPTR